MGWDAKPLLFYLRDRTILNSYDLENEINNEKARESYIIVMSLFARELPSLRSAYPLMEIPGQDVRVLRYYPPLGTPFEAR